MRLDWGWDWRGAGCGLRQGGVWADGRVLGGSLLALEQCCLFGAGRERQIIRPVAQDWGQAIAAGSWQRPPRRPPKSGTHGTSCSVFVEGASLSVEEAPASLSVGLGLSLRRCPSLDLVRENDVCLNNAVL